MLANFGIGALVSRFRRLYPLQHALVQTSERKDRPAANRNEGAATWRSTLKDRSITNGWDGPDR
jgi:hypothetical protein